MDIGVKMMSFFKRIHDLIHGYREPLPFTAPQPMDSKGKRFYADQLIHNPIYEEVMQTIERDCMDNWKNTPVDATETREYYYMQYRVLKQVDSYIKGYVSNAYFEEQVDRLINDQAKAVV